jgi:molybdopterin-guanine dinucleotide biosynthesis protein
VKSMARPLIVGVGGFTSNVGKTTLMCELLRAFPGWEAIKTTRGHYRSCGKDPGACCISHMLGDEPLVRSGRSDTYEIGKDTGRYWDAGASNVHWLIATEQQIDKGIHIALERVRSRGVFVEGNSFTDFINPDFFVMMKRSDNEVIKRSAKRAIRKTSALFILGNENCAQSNSLSERYSDLGFPIYQGRDFTRLISQISSRLQSPRYSPPIKETLGIT